MAINKIKDRLVADFEAKIAEVNAACANGTNADVEGKLVELKHIENEYRTVLEKEVFASCDDVHAALVKYSFQTISHKKKTNDNGVMVGVEENWRTVQIDLRKFCEYKGFDLGWYYEMQALNKRLTLKVAADLGVSAKEMKEIDDSYAMDKLSREIELGKTPTSDTQCVKHMQKVLDMLSEGEGRVNGHDLAYIWLCYAKKNNKHALRVMCSKHSVLQGLLSEVFHRVVTGGSYGVEYKRKPANEVAEKDAKKDAKPVKAKKAKKVAEPETVVVKKDVAAAA